MSNASRSLKLFFLNYKFIGSYKSATKVPNNKLPEFCIIGRSNVGKSSIINAIAKSKKLAKISKTPGRTQGINLYTINNKINIVDLPGYGYASVSKLKRKELSYIINSYIFERKNLIQAFVLIDCKVGIKEKDIDILDLLIESNRNFSIIITKIDKCALSYVKMQNQSMTSLLKNYKPSFNKIFSSSSIKNIGIIDIQKEILNLSKVL